MSLKTKKLKTLLKIRFFQEHNNSRYLRFIVLKQVVAFY